MLTLCLALAQESSVVLPTPASPATDPTGGFGGGVGIGDGSLLHGNLWWTRRKGADFELLIGAAPTFLLDGGVSVGPGVGAGLALFLHGSHQGRRGWVQSGVRFDVAARYGSVEGMLVSSNLVGASYMRRTYREDASRSFTWDIGGGVGASEAMGCSTYGCASAVAVYPVLWWGFTWDWWGRA